MTTAVNAKRGNINALHTKAFSAWINHTLRKQNIRIEDCTRDLSSGIVLIRLIEELTGTRCDLPYKANAANRTFAIDNVSVALQYLSRFLPNVAIAPADVVDGNVQVILGLLWRLILKWQQNVFQPKVVTTTATGVVGEEEGQSVVKKTKDAKAKLLEWIRSKVSSYPHVHITDDLAVSFDNGMALCALVHAYDARLIAYEQLDPNRKLDNLALGMQLAEQYLGVPRLLEPGDVQEADDKAMMLYLYEFPKAFLSRMQMPVAEVGDEASKTDELRRKAEMEEEARRRAAMEEEARKRAAMEEEARRRAAMEEEARRRAAMEEEARRRAAMEEEARKRAAMEEEARRRAEEDEARRRAEEERMKMFHQFNNAPPPQYPPASQYPPQQYPTQYPPPGGFVESQVITQTIVIKEGSNIGKLVVEVISAKNLKSHDVITNSANPYCIVQVERQKERTRKEKKTLNPNFHERFNFYVSEPYATVDVCVYSANKVMQDDFLGRVEVPVKTLQFDTPKEGWYPLQPLIAGKTVTGELCLRILLTKG